MHTYSSELIKEFIRKEDIALLPGLLIQLYEDESISQYFIYSDAMRLLRNKAAHEPSSLLAALNKTANKRCAVFVIDGERKVRIDWCNVLINLYAVYVQTLNADIISLAVVLFKIMQIPPSPYVLSDMGLRMCDDILATTAQIIDESPVLRNTNVMNDFHCKLLHEEPGKYLRLALPSWLSFISIGLQKIYSVSFYEYLINVDRLRST